MKDYCQNKYFYQFPSQPLSPKGACQTFWVDPSREKRVSEGNNYTNLNYSTLEVDAHILKLFSYPFYFVLMTILSTIIMLNSKQLKNSTIKIATGLFLCVIIYYINNLFYIMGTTEKIYLQIAIWTPLLLLFSINVVMLQNINEK